MDNRVKLAGAAIASVLAFVIGCGGEADGGDEEAGPPAPPVAAAPQPVSLQLAAVGGSTVGGEVTATHGADSTLVRITLRGLTVGRGYEAEVRRGDCTVAEQFIR